MEEKISSIAQSIGKLKVLSVTIKRPDRVEFTGNVKAISSVNMRGPFDVLPFHSNFISLIKDKVTIHHEDKDPVTYQLQAGIIKVTGNTVTVLVGIETHF
jgi:F0F1-type ATP synthase epsilon subunit